MRRNQIKIKRYVPITIFETDDVSYRINSLLEKLNDDFTKRYDDILGFISNYVKKDYLTISIDRIKHLFKKYLYKQILDEAIERVFSQTIEYNVKNVILEVLTTDRIKKAIYGEPMTYAFTNFIRRLKEDAFKDGIQNEQVRIEVERKFSPKTNNTNSI